MSLLFLICCITTMLVNLKSQLDYGPLTPSNIVGIIFFGMCAIICVFFFGLARKWRILMMRWTHTEIDFMCMRYEKPSTFWSMRKKIRIFLLTACVMGLLEHLLSLTDNIVRHIFIINYCNLNMEYSFGFFVAKYQGFIVKNLPFKYNNFVGVIIVYLNVSYTFYWNFLDIFNILISLGLSDLFERFNYRLESLKSLQLDEIAW